MAMRSCFGNERRKRRTASRLDVPDLLGELQNRTELPRRVLADILVQYGRLADAAINPSAFVDAATAIVQAGKRLLMTDGVVYKPLDEWWAQSLFAAETDVPLDRLVPAEHAPLDHIITDSNIEAELGKALDISGAIKVFAKLAQGLRSRRHSVHTIQTGRSCASTKILRTCISLARARVI
jgi:type III restriction enzyme